MPAELDGADFWEHDLLGRISISGKLFQLDAGKLLEARDEEKQYDGIEIINGPWGLREFDDTLYCN